MLLGIGYAVPFSFLGIVLSFVAFSVVFLVTMGIRQILEYQDFIW
jgi:hypothetical protein